MKIDCTLDASWLEAREASRFLGNSLAKVTTFKVLTAEPEWILWVNLW